MKPREASNTFRGAAEEKSLAFYHQHFESAWWKTQTRTWLILLTSGRKNRQEQFLTCFKDTKSGSPPHSPLQQQLLSYLHHTKPSGFGFYPQPSIHYLKGWQTSQAKTYPALSNSGQIGACCENHYYRFLGPQVMGQIQTSHPWTPSLSPNLSKFAVSWSAEPTALTLDMLCFLMGNKIQIMAKTWLWKLIAGPVLLHF